MKFISTRGGECVTGAQAIAQGIAKDGGLFVPETFPSVSEKEMEEMLAMNYAERAACVLHKFPDDYDFDGLKAACDDLEQLLESIGYHSGDSSDGSYDADYTEN